MKHPENEKNAKSAKACLEPAENKPPKKGCRSGLLAVLLMIVIVSLFSACADADSNAADEAAPSSAAQTAEQQNTEDEKKDEENKPVTEEEKKAAAIELNYKVIDLVAKSEEDAINLSSANLHDESADKSELHDLAETSEKVQSEILAQLEELRNDDNKEYLDLVQKRVTRAQKAAECTIKYLDEGKSEDLNEANEWSRDPDNLTFAIVDAEKEYLSKMGVSEAEIGRILSGEIL